MIKKDFRKHTPQVQKELRIMAVNAVSNGATQQEAADLVGVSRQIVSGWMKLYRSKGEGSLSGKKRGRSLGEKTILTNSQCNKIKRWITDTSPEQLQFPFALWTRKAIQTLIEKKFQIKLPLRTISDYLRRWGFTAQRPKKQAIEQQPEAIKKWIDKEYPKIAKKAKRAKAEIHWGDETGVRSNTNYGRSYAPKGKTPVIKQTAKHISANVISTVTNQGCLRFMVYESNFDAKVFLVFLERLIKGAERKIFLILDNLSVHHAKIVKEWVSIHKNAIELFFLPPYAPEYNPDELLNNHLKQNVNKKRIPKTQDELISNIQEHLSSIQGQPEIIKGFFGAPTLKYAS